MTRSSDHWHVFLEIWYDIVPHVLGGGTMALRYLGASVQFLQWNGSSEGVTCVTCVVLWFIRPVTAVTSDCCDRGWLVGDHSTQSSFPHSKGGGDVVTCDCHTSNWVVKTIFLFQKIGIFWSIQFPQIWSIWFYIEFTRFFSKFKRKFCRWMSFDRCHMVFSTFLVRMKGRIF
jgi:hypothetical protein